MRYKGRIFYIFAWVIVCGVLVGCSEKEKINYNEYIKKVWVVDGWHGGENRYHAKIYFTIDDIDGDFISGRYGMGESIHVIDDDMRIFRGEVSGDTAVCDLYIDSNEAGKMSLYFYDDGKIHAEIDYMYLDGLSKSYVFRSYDSSVKRF